MKCPFEKGDIVVWSDDAPKEWWYIHTPGPMKVVDFWWSDGIPTKYAMMFGSNGMDFRPGWIVTVEYDADSTSYYDPPLSLILHQKEIRKMVHQMWLKPL